MSCVRVALLCAHCILVLRRAMEGDTPFHEALDMRLKVMQPTKQGMAEFMAGNPIRLSPRECHVTAQALPVHVHVRSC